MEPAYKAARRIGGDAGFAGDRVDLDDYLLNSALTVEGTGRKLAKAMPGMVQRYAMPNLRGLSFAVDGALLGGVRVTLNAGLQEQKAAAYVLPNVDIEAP